MTPTYKIIATDPDNLKVEILPEMGRWTVTMKLLDEPPLREGSILRLHKEEENPYLTEFGDDFLELSAVGFPVDRKNIEHFFTGKVMKVYPVAPSENGRVVVTCEVKQIDPDLATGGAIYS